MWSKKENETTEVPKVEVPEDYNDFDNQQLFRVIEELVVATKERIWPWHLFPQKDSPYPSFMTTVSNWQITIENNYTHYSVTVEQDRLSPRTMLLHKTYHPPRYADKTASNAYAVVESLWTAILKQPEQLKKEVDDIIKCLRENGEDNGPEEQQDSSL